MNVPSRKGLAFRTAQWRRILLRDCLRGLEKVRYYTHLINSPLSRGNPGGRFIWWGILSWAHDFMSTSQTVVASKSINKQQTDQFPPVLSPRAS